MENRKKAIVVLFALAMVFSIGIGIWAMTQKVEADRQREAALNARTDAEISKQAAEKTKREAEIQVKALSEELEVLKGRLEQLEAKK